MSTLADPALLKEAEMFDCLDDEGRRSVMEAGFVRTLPAGRIVFAQGDPGATCHMLLKGRIKMVQTRQDGAQAVIRFICPGEMYGTVAALMDQPFPAEAVAVVDSLEIYWPTPVLRQLLERFPELAVRSTSFLGSRLMELQERVTELSMDKVEQRLARALLRLVRTAGRPTDKGIAIDFPITRQELAELAGATLHTVSRTLAAWDDQEITSSTRRHIFVKKLNVLTQLAEPKG